MSADTPDPRPPRRVLTRPRLLLAGVMLACLAGLLTFLLAGSDGSGQGASDAGVCSGQGAPHVLSVAPKELGDLRAAVARVLPERVGRLYEEGAIGGSSVWTDAAPSGPTVDPGERRSGGYEMRWWAPNGDDLVADVLVFSSPATAARFLERASAPRCGHSSLAGPAGRPPQARNLAWTNPQNTAEADVYLARGRHVYRVADAPAGQSGGRLSLPGLTRALRTVDALACLLRGAHCSSVSRNVPT